MRRLLLALLVVIVIGSSIAAIRHHNKSLAKQESEAKYKRDSAYESGVRSYSQKFQLGMTRGKVEEHLRAEGISFTQMVTVDERGGYVDLIKIGEEEHPWYCSENYVYVALEFAATETHNPAWKVSDHDVLKEIRRHDELGGCL